MIEEKDRFEVATDLTIKIESCLEAFGITGKVLAVNFEYDKTVLELSLAPGVRVEEVESLSKTFALVVASPTGRVNLIVPIPGKSMIGIEVPHRPE